MYLENQSGPRTNDENNELESENLDHGSNIVSCNERTLCFCTIILLIASNGSQGNSLIVHSWFS